MQLNLQTVLVDGHLLYKNLLCLWIDKESGQIQLKGTACQEYF